MEKDKNPPTEEQLIQDLAPYYENQDYKERNPYKEIIVDKYHLQPTLSQSDYVAVERSCSFFTDPTTEHIVKGLRRYIAFTKEKRKRRIENRGKLGKRGLGHKWGTLLEADILIHHRESDPNKQPRILRAMRLMFHSQPELEVFRKAGYTDEEIREALSRIIVLHDLVMLFYKRWGNTLSPKRNEIVKKCLPKDCDLYKSIPARKTGKRVSRNSIRKSVLAFRGYLIDYPKKTMTRDGKFYEMSFCYLAYLFGIAYRLLDLDKWLNPQGLYSSDARTLGFI